MSALPGRQMFRRLKKKTHIVDLKLSVGGGKKEHRQ